MPQSINLPADFYTDYWQQKPLLIRNAIAGFELSMSADELAGLACMDASESRIVIERDGSTPWEVRYGPFTAQSFESLPATHWTLLVQAVDHWDQDIADLKRLWPEIPAWRFDDVMVSYAVDGGGVGPHFDHYDVFLLQGAGRRRWHVGPRADASAHLLPATDLRILADFTATSTYDLEPGDMLYLPPHFAHNGIAIGESMTVSIGFRAPAHAEIVDGFAAHVAEQLPEFERYRDGEIMLGENRTAGEIDAETIESLLSTFRAQFSDSEMARWFAAYVSARKYAPESLDVEEAQIATLLDTASRCRAKLDSRFAFVAVDGGVELFADGERYVCEDSARTCIEALCVGGSLARAEIAANRDLLLALALAGTLDLD